MKKAIFVICLFVLVGIAIPMFSNKKTTLPNQFQPKAVKMEEVEPKDYFIMGTVNFYPIKANNREYVAVDLNVTLNNMKLTCHIQKESYAKSADEFLFDQPYYFTVDNPYCKFLYNEEQIDFNKENPKVNRLFGVILYGWNNSEIVMSDFPNNVVTDRVNNKVDFVWLN